MTGYEIAKVVSTLAVQVAAILLVMVWINGLFRGKWLKVRDTFDNRTYVNTKNITDVSVTRLTHHEYEFILNTDYGGELTIKTKHVTEYYKICNKLGIPN